MSAAFIGLDLSIDHTESETLSCSYYLIFCIKQTFPGEMLFDSAGKKRFLCATSKGRCILDWAKLINQAILLRKKLYMQYQYEGISIPILLDYIKIECEFHRKGSRI